MTRRRASRSTTPSATSTTLPGCPRETGPRFSPTMRSAPIRGSRIPSPSRRRRHDFVARMKRSRVLGRAIAKSGVRDAAGYPDCAFARQRALAPSGLRQCASAWRFAMDIQGLGYIGVRAKDLGDWSSYGTAMLGLQRIDKSRSTLAFRMDDRKQRLVVEADGGQGIAFFGWEVADAAALDAFAARMEATGISVAHGSRALAQERHVQDLLVLHDPAGNRLEVFHGAESTTDPFKPGRNISGFRTGALGMGHVVLHFERIAEMMAFYQDVLGFKLSDYWLRPFPGYFFHVNARHHSIAFVETGINMVHHMMMELYSFDDVGQGYDLALGEPERIGVTLGRHSGDYVTSFRSEEHTSELQSLRHLVCRPLL